MEMVVYTIVAVVLYLAADRIVDYVERSRGARLQYRTIYFFVLLLVMALISFWILRNLWA